MSGGCFEVGGDPAGPPTDGGASADSGALRDSATPRRDTSPPMDGSASDGAPTDSSMADSGPADTSSTVNCPDVFGAFSVFATGIGCGDLDNSATQRIDGDRMACAATFSSAGALNGTATISGAGSLSGASLTLGTGGGESCTGMWAAATSTWTLSCGSAGPSRCNIQLVRSGP